MPIYNPYNSERDYYNPYENVQEQGGPSLGRVLFTQAKIMAVFGLLNAVGRTATKLVSSKAASYFAKGPKAPKTLGDVIQKTRLGQSATNIYRQATQPFRKALQAKDSYVAAVAKRAGGVGAASKIASFQSSFKDFRTFAGSVGRMWKNTVWAGAGVAYAVDSFAGITQDYGIKPKAWYDVPGHIGNFGKWLAMDSIFTMGFSGALKATNLAGAVGKTALRKSFSGPMGDAAARFLQRVAPDGAPDGFRGQSLHSGGNILRREVYEKPQTNYQQYFVSNMIRKAMAFGRTVAGAKHTMDMTVRELGNNFATEWKRGYTHPVRTLKRAASDPVAGALRQIKQIWKEAQSNKKQMSPLEHSGLNVLQFTDELAKKLQGNVGRRNPKAGVEFTHFTEEIAKIGKAQRGKRTLADEIFPEMDRVTNRDVVDQDWVERTQGILRKSYGRKASSQFMDAVLNMHSGLNIYKPKGSNIVGGGVDLGFLDPLHTAKKALNFALNRSIKVPFTGFDLNFADLLQTQFFLGESPSFNFFRGRQDFEIGKGARIRDSAGSWVQIDHGRVASTSQIDDQAWFTTYVNGKMAMVGPTGAKIVDTGNRILPLAPNSSYRQAERDRVERRLNEGTTRRTRGLQPYETGNKYVDFFLNKSQLGWPGSVKRLSRSVLNALSGKPNSYVDAAKHAFTDNADEWYRYGDIIHALKEQTGQDIVGLFHNERFLSTLGDVTHSSRFGDTYDVMFSSRSLRKKLEDMETVALRQGKDWAQWLNKRGIAQEVALIKADPTYAEGHIVTKRLGHHTEMNAYDKVRVALFEDTLIDSFTWGDGVEHPIVSAIPKLLEQGAINGKQAKSLSLFAKLSAFTETGMYARRNGLPPTGKIRELGQQMVLRSQQLNWNIEKEIIDYASQGQFRSASQRKIEARLSSDKQFHRFHNNTPYVSVGKGPFQFAHAYTETVFNNVTNMLHDTIFPFRRDPSAHMTIPQNMGYLFGGIAKLSAGMFALKALDSVIAANPVFDDTALDAGLGPFLADNVARVRLAQSKAFDALGVTGVAKHLNGLLPGFVTSAPGAIVGGVVSRTLGGGPLGLMKGMAFGAISNRLLSPYLPDFTKSYDQLEDEYQGKTEVPIMKSPTWLLGSTPYEGSKVIGYQPNWYVRMKSRWKETDTLYGSTMRRLLHEPLPLLGISIGDFVDPYYMERKHFFSRPYPETGDWGSEIPLIGPLIAGTMGRIFKPKKTMHQEFLTGPDELTKDSAYPFSIQPPTMAENKGRMYHTAGLRKQGGRSSLMGTFVYGGESKMWGQVAGQQFLNNVQQFAGLPGFLAGTLKDKLVEPPLVIPTLETAGRMASQSRAYYDMNLGGMGVFTEPIRRIIEKSEYRKYGINPIPNLMPNWLPQEFLTGDPYEKIIKGELRLPGKAYQVTHNVRKTMPARSSMFGAPEEHMIQYFTGLLPPLLKEEYDILSTGTTMHAQIQDHLAAEGLLIQAEALVFDVKNDISGHVDAIIRDGTGGKGKKALEIKSINQEAFDKLSGPKDQHVGQLNFYLKQLGLQKGSIMYVSRENPSNVKLFNINYSSSRFSRDLRKLQKARQVAADMMGRGYDDRFGYSYSWLDRLYILADVAPTSKEYKEAKFFVEKQIKAGILSEAEMTKYSKALQHRQTRLRRYELYPNRFKGKVFSPDTTRNIQSINEDIKAGDQYTLPERIIGSIWERFTNTNTFLTNKLFAFKDPLEHYKMLRLYGKEYKPWDELYGSFVEPTTRSMISQTNPIGGAYKWALPSYIMFGPAAALAGGIVGAGWGTVHGAYRAATGTGYIPEMIQDQRDIEQFFDAAKFARNKRAYELSQGLVKNQYHEQMSATLTAYNQTGEDVANLFRATPYMEKPYIEPWLNVRNRKEREEILKYAPTQLGMALKRQWNKRDQKEDNQIYDALSSKDLAAGAERMAFDRRILDPSVELEDIKLKTVEEAGFNAHDFGLGWNEQMYRLMGSYDKIQSANLQEAEPVTPTNLNPGQVRQTIIELCTQRGFQARAQVYINEGERDMNFVNITIRRDRSLAVVNSLRNRAKYYG